MGRSECKGSTAVERIKEEFSPINEIASVQLGPSTKDSTYLPHLPQMQSFTPIITTLQTTLLFFLAFVLAPHQ